MRSIAASTPTNRATACPPSSSAILNSVDFVPGLTTGTTCWWQPNRSKAPPLAENQRRALSECARPNLSERRRLALGFPNQAVERSGEALMLAEKLGQPSMSALANYFTAMLFQYRRDLSAVERSAEATIGIATEHGFPFWLAQGLIMRGWSLAEQSQSEIGVVQLRQGLTAWVSTGAETYSTYFFALLAEALARDGQIEEALEVLTEALARMERKNERFPQGGVASSSG